MEDGYYPFQKQIDHNPHGLLFVRDRRKDTKEYVEQATRKYVAYKDIHSLIKLKGEERGKLQKELAGLPMFAIGRRKELKARIVELSEQIEELQFEEKSIMRGFDKADAVGMKEVEGEISKSEARIVKLDTQKAEFTGAINREKEKFNWLKARAVDLDQDELTAVRFALRPQMENEGCERIRKGAPDGRISFTKYQVAVRDADRALTENSTGKRYQKQKRKKKFENGFHQEKGR